MDADFAKIVDSAKDWVYTAETAEEAALSREEILHRMRLAELRMAVIDRLGRSAEECQRAGMEKLMVPGPLHVDGPVAHRLVEAIRLVVGNSYDADDPQGGTTLTLEYDKDTEFWVGGIEAGEFSGGAKAKTLEHLLAALEYMNEDSGGNIVLDERGRLMCGECEGSGIVVDDGQLIRCGECGGDGLDRRQTDGYFDLSWETPSNRVDPVAPPPTVAGGHQLTEETQAEIKIVVSIEDGQIVIDADWPSDEAGRTVKASRFAESVGDARVHALGLAERAINAVICEDMLASEDHKPDEHQRLSDAVRDYLEARGVLSECRAYDLPTEIERLTAALGNGESP